jgi:hypothetical protein
MANVAYTTIPTKSENITSPVASDLRQLEIQFNEALQTLYRVAEVAVGDGVIEELTLSIGTTVTLAVGAGVITIAGETATISADTGKAFGSLGTIPTGMWGIIGVDCVANGTLSFVSGAANYTTGYATEALAIAAAPAKTAAKARAGYVTVYPDHASGWVAGTDALAGGTGGNPAAETNYYSVKGAMELTAPSANEKLLGCGGWTCSEIATRAGTVLAAANY